MTGAEYAQKVFDIIEYFKTDIIQNADVAPLAEVKTRYITSHGQDEEQWQGFLTDESGNIDLWMITLTGVRGLLSRDSGMMGGAVDKPISLRVDYAADYKFGLDSANTEADFLTKALSFDLMLERKRDCLPNGVRIVDYDLRFGLKHFKSATVHLLRGDVQLLFVNTKF